MNKFKYLIISTAWTLLIGSAAAEELSETGTFVDGVAAVVNEGVVLKSELYRQQDLIIARATQQGIELPPAHVLREQVLERAKNEHAVADLKSVSDDRYLATGIDAEGGGRSDIWIYDLSRNVGSRLTFDEARDTNPVWSPDGKRVAFTSKRGGEFGIYVRNADGRDNVKAGQTVAQSYQHP